MEQQYMTVIIALSSGLVGSVIGSGLTLLSSHLANRSAENRLRTQLRHERGQRSEELLRTRGEELYTVTSAWLKWMFGHRLRTASVMLGDITYDQLHSLLLKEGKPTFDFDRVEMLINTYFPSVRASYDAVLAERDRINEIELVHKREYTKVGPGANQKQVFDSYEKSLAVMEGLENKLKMTIVEALRRIGSE